MPGFEQPDNWDPPIDMVHRKGGAPGVYTFPTVPSGWTPQFKARVDDTVSRLFGREPLERIKAEHGSIVVRAALELAGVKL